MKFKVLVALLCLTHQSHQQMLPQQQPRQKPNVVIIMADDLAWDDVSYHGSNQIPTPNIDALAFNGAILNRFYTPPLCTPSRGSLMTGKYPHRLGLQTYVIVSDEGWGLPKDEKIMPQYFKEAGYSTSLVGKWHLGFYQEQYTPTKRGFDSFFGYLGPYIDYNDYTLKMFDRNYSRGFDMRRNSTPANDFDPIYATHLFTNEAVNVIENHDKNKPMFLLLNHLAPHAGNEDFPMQAPQDEIDKFSYIENEDRRILAAMISILDRSVGTVVQALADNKMLENTVIVFYSDNGGPTLGLHATMASNYPFRGQKNSGWEGAIRNNALIYAPFMQKQGVVRNQMMHVTDLLPTLGHLTGVRFDNRNRLDGIDQWNVINYDWRSARQEVVSIDDVAGCGALISGNYKFVNGSSTAGKYDGFLSAKSFDGDNDSINYAINVLNSTASRAILSIQTRNRLNLDKIFYLRNAATVRCSNNVEKTPCDLLKGACLFDIWEDPCEENNLANSRRLAFNNMKSRYFDKVKSFVPSGRPKQPDPACDPVNFNGNWHWWQQDS